MASLAATYDRCAFVIVENDSDDGAKQMLRDWVDDRPDAHLIDLDGLAQRPLLRAERMAICRNAYLDFIRSSPYAGFDHVVILDADGVTRTPVDLQSFERARDWLTANGAAAVFANAPVYYDIWALRHPTWCPTDCLADVTREKGRLTKPVARRKFVDDRQIVLAPGSPPMEVDSAFGGLGVYDLKYALASAYSGVDAEGREICEHVPFNRDIGRISGCKLFILPWLIINGSRVPLPEARQAQLAQGGRECSMTVPVEHPIDRFRNGHPLYDRRLPVLARLLGEAEPGSLIVDIGANVGDTVALCRLEGCTLPIVAVEASLTFFKFMIENSRNLRKMFRDVHPVWAFVGRPGDSTAIKLERGTAHQAGSQNASSSTIETAPLESIEQILASLSVPAGALGLVKIDTDGHDQTIILNELEFLRRTKPIVWAEAHISEPGQEAQWREILSGAAGTWSHLVAFDNYGFAYCAGATADKAESCLDLISYARRHRAQRVEAFGRRPIVYPDVVLFPPRYAAVFEAFCRALPELEGG